ncbi:MAG: PA0069 family radical SAM protein [Myxococcota bacterium]|jgi:DNA repair photolyase|nr:PA0069 family radical SAM protein [Myxococcota bacterium]
MSSAWNPHNPLEVRQVEWDQPPPPQRLEIREDHSKGILTRNDSPDLPFRWSLNPYRGCTHACAYCYARRYHEFLGMGAGSDFERRITIKPRAAELLEAEFLRQRWKGERIAFSGVTDCYQPLERKYALTRACLQVAARYRNPVAIITRSPLVVRDADILVELNRHCAVSVNVSLPLLDPELCRALEPGAPGPQARLDAISALSEVGVPVGVSVSPVIPGLSDRALPETLRQAREAGARWAWMMLLRLPGSVEAVFERRLAEALPLRVDAVMARLRRSRGGRTNDTRFGDRRRGQDESWRVVEQLFELWHRRLGFEVRPPVPATTPFRRPGQGRQVDLFGAP